MGLTIPQTSPKGRSGSASSQATTFGTLPAIGSMIVVNVMGYNAATFAANSVTDNQTGNVYSRALQAPAGSGGARVEIWFCPRVIGSTGTFTVTVNTPAGSTIVVSATEVAGFTNPIVDKTATSSQAGTTAPTTGTTPVTLRGDEYLVGGTTVNSGGTYTVSARNVAGSNPSSGWASVLNETDSSGFQAGDIVSVISSTPGAMAHIWTITSDGWDSGIVTFREAIFPPFPRQTVRLVR